MEAGISLSNAAESLAGALLIGLLIGGQREAAHRDTGQFDSTVGTPPGLRDFLIIALIAGVLGFYSLEGMAMWIAKVLFLIFVVLFIVSLVMGRRGPMA